MTKTRKMAECGVAVALAAVLSFIKVWQMPQGGSVSLVMVPLFLIAYRHGALWGMATGVVYSIIAMLIDMKIYHPLSILLDYVLAFGVIGVAGFFKADTKGILIGTTVGVAGRFLSSFLSGWLLFASYAPEGQSPFMYSLGYQATYLIPELILNIIVLMLVYKKAGHLFKTEK